MLQKLNERIQGVVAWVVIILIAMTFTLFGVDYYMQSHHVSDTEVTVNDQPISKQSFEVNYRRSRQQRDPAEMTAASDAALKKEVLDEMIVNQLSVQAAHHAGFEVSVEQANNAILNIPQFQEDGHFSAERYEQALNSAMYTPESFQREVKQGMLLNQQRFAFIGSAFVLPGEVSQYVKLYMQTRDYDYLQISTADFMDKKNVSDQQINEYYKKNPQEFVDPEKVSIDFVRLSMQKVREGLQVKDEDIQHYYDENQNNFQVPAQWKVAHILFAIPEDANDESQNQIKEKADEAYQALQNNPTQFTHWAKTMSADKLAANTNGELPWISAGQTTFDKALSTLTKPGQISEPLQTPKGYEIFKLVDYKPSELKPLSDVKEQIAEQLMTETAQSQYAQLLEQLTDLSYQTPDSLTPVAEEMKLNIEHTPSFTKEGGKTDITSSKQIINTAFSHDVLELGNNSEPVQLDNDSVIVLRVNKHIPASEKPLIAVKDRIIEKLALVQAEEKAQKFGAQLITGEIKSDAHQYTWHEVEEASRDSDKANSIINELAFSLARPDSSDGRRLENGDYVIVRLKKINEGQYEKLDKEQQASLAQQIEANYGLMDYDLYVNNLVSKAKIEHN